MKKNPATTSGGAAANDIPYEEFSKWNPEELTNYLKKLEVPVGDNLIRHRISGDLIPLLTDRDYENLGYSNLGDMLKVKRAFAVFQRKARSAARTVTLWEADEYVLPTFFDTVCCLTQCYNLDNYKLTPSTLSLRKKKQALICGCIPAQGTAANILRCLYGTEYEVNNVSLSQITDVDSAGKTADCCKRCCGIPGIDTIIITNRNGEETEHHTLNLPNGEANRVVALIRDAAEETKEH